MKITLSDEACNNLPNNYNNKGCRSVTFISFHRLVEEYLCKEHKDKKIVGINIKSNGLELEIE